MQPYPLFRHVLPSVKLKKYLLTVIITSTSTLHLKDTFKCAKGLQGTHSPQPGANVRGRSGSRQSAFRWDFSLCIFYMNCERRTFKRGRESTYDKIYSSFVNPSGDDLNESNKNYCVRAYFKPPDLRLITVQCFYSYGESKMNMGSQQHHGVVSLIRQRGLITVGQSENKP